MQRSAATLSAVANQRPGHLPKALERRDFRQRHLLSGPAQIKQGVWQPLGACAEIRRAADLPKHADSPPYRGTSLALTPGDKTNPSFHVRRSSHCNPKVIPAQPPKQRRCYQRAARLQLPSQWLWQTGRTGRRRGCGAHPPAKRPGAAGTEASEKAPHRHRASRNTQVQERV